MRALALAVLALVGCNATPPPVVDSHLHEQDMTVMAKELSPEVVLAVDTSAAMAPQLDALRTTLEPFLNAHSDTAVWGLTRFPAAAKPACTDAAFDTLAPIPTTDEQAGPFPAQTAQVVSAVDALNAAGERDVAATLTGVKFNDPNRDHAILLITSGDDACGTSLADTVKGLRYDNTRTIVVAFGPSAAPLDDVAVAGGFARACPTGTDAECGANNSCDVTTGMCSHASFVAPDAASLSAVLNAFTVVVGSGNTCDFLLDTVPSQGNRLSVIVNGAVTPASFETWMLDGDKVQFVGAMCNLLSNSTQYTPVHVQFLVDDRP